MDREQEKDLYIKSKLKDTYIPEKIDDLFNNSIKLVEKEGGSYMGTDNNLPKKNPIIFRRIAAIAACAIITLGSGNIYATTQGYDNIFFMIKEWVKPYIESQDRDEILSDRDITISYKPIQITENINIIISKMQIKDNEAKINLLVNRTDKDNNNELPLEYKIYNGNKKILCHQISEENGNSNVNTFEEKLILKEYSEEDRILNLEIYKSNKELITTITIDLKNKEISVKGQEEHLQKISEIELKEFLGSISILPETESSITLSGGQCIDISNISYSGGYYTITYTYCFLEDNSLFEIDINNINIFQNTVAIKLNEQENPKFVVVSMEEPIIIQKKQINNSTENIGTELWPDFEGTYALKNAYTQRLEINPKEWNSWTDNNWVVFHEDGRFTDTLFSKIFSESLTVSGTYIFKHNSVELTYSNGEVITLKADIDNLCLTGKVDEYEITIMAYGHADLSKRDSKFVGSWDLKYGLDWTTGVAQKMECKELYDETIYGEVYGANITLMENGSIEYSIEGKQKVSRKIGEWENVLISDNTIKVSLDDGTKIYMKYELDQYGKEYIGFQSKYNDMYYEYYSKEKETVRKENNFKEGTYTLLNSQIKELVLGENKIPHIELNAFIKLENNKYTIYNIPYETKTAEGMYEILDNNIIKCNIDESRSIEFQIVDENNLKVTNLNSDDSETEFNIRLYYLFGVGNQYVLYEKNDLTGTWKTSCVYRDMGGGEFWKTESNPNDYYFRFLTDGTYEQHYFEENYLYKGAYELENNQIDLDTNSQGNYEMYVIDNDTILYILGTQYKIILTRE